MHETPARLYVNAFFDAVARRVAKWSQGRSVTILDVGCGRCPLADAFDRHDISGRYIGLDLHPNPSEAGRPSLVREHIPADAHDVDLARLPMVDVIVSATALEHLRDDAAVLARLSSNLKAGGWHAHAVPAEASLELYRAHGYRQYSPICLRHLFSEGAIHGYGARWSNRLHKQAVTQPVIFDGLKPMSVRSPRRYRTLRRIAMQLDGVVGHSDPVIYGVIARSSRTDQSSSVATRSE